MKTQLNTNRPPNLLQGLRTFVRSHIIGTITATIAGSLLLTGVSTFNIWSIYNGFQAAIDKQFDLEKTIKDLAYQDEVLTMSARMLVSTGDLQWENRYLKMVPVYDESLKKFKSNIPPELLSELSKTDESTTKLLALEDKAFKLVKQGKQQEAAQILNSNEYNTQKKIYSDVNQKLLTTVERSIEQRLNNYGQRLFGTIAFAGVTLPLLICCARLYSRSSTGSSRDRRVAS
jgi:twitching motility protein PilJ